MKSRSTFLIFGALSLLVGCGRSQEHQTATRLDLPLARVRVQPAESKTHLNTEEVVGTVVAKVRAALEAKVSGRITEMPVALGQKVMTGTMLARLDASEIKARLDQAEAGLDQANRDWKRISALFAGQAATQSDYDTADSRRRAALAAVEEARAMLGYVEITAPFDGVVTKKWADVGDLAAPGKPLIDLQDLSTLQLVADVPESLASKIKSGAELDVQVNLINGRITGVVKEISPFADPASHTFRVKLDLPQTAGLMSGQFARLLLPVGETNSVRVPASAMVERGQMEMVFVLADQHARLRLVKSGKRIGGEVEILSGVVAGDKVVVEGAEQLTDGQPAEAR